MRNVVRWIGCAMAILACSLSLAANSPAPIGPWSVRFALPADQKPEWSKQGYLPSWKMTWADREQPQVRMEDDARGHCRGFAIVGRAFDLPKQLPKELKVSFRYKTYCAANAPPFLRSGQVTFCVFTPDQWNALADDPSRSGMAELARSGENVAYAAPVHHTQEDVVEWSAWTSDSLTAFLRDFAGKRVVFAMAWGAYHYNLVEWGEFAEFRFVVHTEEEMVREFFNRLDLDMPGLEKVKRAVAANDTPSAKAALVDHMKMRTTPVPPPIESRGDARSIAAADEVVNHVFRFVGCPPHQLEKEIRWNEDPFDYDQWAIALNRHSHWLTLGRAYAGTKDEKYAREFVAQLMGWIDAMPVLIGRTFVEGPYDAPGRGSLSLDAGIRMGQTWFPAYYHFLHSPSFTVDANIAMLRSFRDHAVYLMDPKQFKAGSNWGMMEINGLFHIGVMLPEFKDAKAWRDTAAERLSSELDNQFYPDGAQVELTPGYHGVSVGNAAGVLDLAARTGTPLPEGVQAKLERAYAYYLQIMMPDHRTPALNDSGWGGVDNWLKQGAEYFPERADFRYAASAGKEGRPPDFTSCALNYAGWYIMRTGWGENDKYLLFDAGPFGAGHQHEDKLHFIVHAFGRTVLTEPGNYSYDRSAWRKYVLSTRAHNTILVDGQEQNRRRQRDTWRSETPLPNRWITSDGIDYAEGTYCDGYGEKMDKTVTHTRRILFVKPHYWIVVDELKPSDEREHTYESLFHLESPSASIDANTKIVTTTNPTGGNVAVVPLVRSGVDVRIVQGEKEPIVQGWLPTGRHNELRPIPTAVIRLQASGPALLAYAVVPFDGNDLRAVPQVEWASPDRSRPALAIRLRCADGSVQLFTFAGKAGAETTLDGFSTDAEMSLVSLAQDGQPRLLFSLGGTYLKGKGPHQPAITIHQ